MGTRARDDDVPDEGGTFSLTAVTPAKPLKSPRRLPPMGSPVSTKGGKAGASPRSQPERTPRPDRTPMETATFLSTRRIAATKELFKKQATASENAERSAHHQWELSEATATMQRLQAQAREERLRQARVLLNPPMEPPSRKPRPTPQYRPSSARQVTDTMCAHAEALRETAMACLRNAELQRLEEIAHRDAETAMIRSQQVQLACP